MLAAAKLYNDMSALPETDSLFYVSKADKFSRQVVSIP